MLSDIPQCNVAIANNSNAAKSEQHIMDHYHNGVYHYVDCMSTHTLILNTCPHIKTFHSFTDGAKIT